MATQVGEAVIRLTFDGKDVKASLKSVESDVEKSGKSAGSKWGDAWTVAAGNLISNGIGKIISTISSNMDAAIKRVDILNNFPKIMTNMGISADEAQISIDTLAEKLQGLPTSLQDGASAVERFTSKNGDVAKSTKLFLALNNAILAGGAPMEIQATALEQISQAYAKGKPDMMEWRAIQSAMPAQLNQISKALLGNKDSLSHFMKLAEEYLANNPLSSSASELIEQLEAVSNGTGDMTTAMGTALRLGIISMDEFMGTIESMNVTGVDGFQNLEEQARNSTGGIGTALKNVENRIAAAIGKIINYIGSEKIAGVINDISSHFADVADVIINIIDGIVNYWPLISPILVGVMTFLTGLLALNFGQKVLTFLSLLAAHPVIALLGVIAAIIMVIAQNWDYLKEQVENGLKVIGDVLSTVGNFFVEQWNGICDGAKKAWDFITGLFSNLANFFGNIFSNAWTAVKNVFSTGGKIFMGIVDGITSAFKNIVNTIITGINFVVAIPFNAINGFLSFLKGIDILGIKPFDWVGTIDVPQIPLLAQGGIVNGATTAIIGEDGQEAVLPLEHNTDNWAGLLASTLAVEMQEQDYAGREINVYMTNEINNRLDAQEIGRVMVQSIRRAA